MAKKMKVKFDGDAFEAILTSPEALADVRRRVEAIAAACNADSTWGGYDSSATAEGNRARGRVWSYGRSDDEARRQRLVRNLDAGS